MNDIICESITVHKSSLHSCGKYHHKSISTKASLNSESVYKHLFALAWII